MAHGMVSNFIHMFPPVSVNDLFGQGVDDVNLGSGGAVVSS